MNCQARHHGPEGRSGVPELKKNGPGGWVRRTPGHALTTPPDVERESERLDIGPAQWGGQRYRPRATLICFSDPEPRLHAK